MFEDRVVVVTGGASGIGLALAHAFAERGAHLMLADLDEGALAAARDVVGRHGTRVWSSRTDVTDRAAVEALAQETLRQAGGVDIVCNNAGVALFGPLADATPVDWDFVMGVNFWGVVHGVDAFLPIMLEQGRGHFVNTASMSGLIGMEGLGVYCASKFAVVGLSESMRRELAPRGIGVSVLCPMIVDTPINENSKRLRPGDDHVEPDGPLVGGVIPPEAVAERVVDAVAADELYVITHPEQRDILARRAARLDHAAAQVGV